MMFRKGFTLIEMLIVIAIIGILATLVLVGLGPIQRQGRDARRISDLKQVQNGLELYYQKNGSYPTSVGSWGALQTAITGAGVGVTVIPDDPTTGQHYMYGTDGTGTTYVLGAKLEDSGNAALQGSNSLQGFPPGISGWSTGSGNCGSVGGIYCTAL